MRRGTLTMVMVFTLVVGYIGGVAMTLALNHSGTPSCVQEDSCSADYHDGGWYINGVRVTR